MAFISTQKKYSIFILVFTVDWAHTFDDEAEMIL